LAVPVGPRVDAAFPHMEINQMRINTRIPGQMTEEELASLARLAATVPTGGRILELGSLFGLSSWTWAQNASTSVTVYCVDPWQRAPWIEALERKFNVTFGLETFQRHTADCPNIVALPGYSPMDLGDWNLPLDIYFDDSVHTNPIFRQNLRFWLRHVKPGGILCGHDYGPAFPDIVAEVQELAGELGTSPEVVGTFWVIHLPQDYSHPDGSTSEPKPAPLAGAPLPLGTAPPLPDNVGTMMKQQELDLLFTLARDWYQGLGAIIDLGPFLGSSTLALAEGLTANAREFERFRRIFSFDRFWYEPNVGFDAFINKAHLSTESFFSHYLHNIWHYIDMVYCSPGDLMNFTWNQNQDRVELLFIDAAQSWDLNDHIVKQFFGALIPGTSIVVQQDYYFYMCPWVIQTMEHFAPWLEYVGEAPGASAYFQSKAAIPSIVLRTPVNTACSPVRRNQLMEEASGKRQGNLRSILELARATHLAFTDHRDLGQVIFNHEETLTPQKDGWTTALRWNKDKARRFFS